MKEWVQPSLTHSALKDLWVRVSTALDGATYSLLVVFLYSVVSQRMMKKVIPRER